MKHLRRHNEFRWTLAMSALVLCGSLAGCGSGSGEVSGTVRFNGKPLPFGTIQFLGQDGIPCSGAIQSDGTFSVTVPAGQARVIIRCVDETRLSHFTSRMAGRHGRAASPMSAPGQDSLIPQRYSDWDTSRLTVLVQSGKTVQDFDLTSN
jgi:hypothetical protein